MWKTRLQEFLSSVLLLTVMLNVFSHFSAVVPILASTGVYPKPEIALLNVPDHIKSGKEYVVTVYLGDMSSEGTTDWNGAQVYFKSGAVITNVNLGGFREYDLRNEDHTGSSFGSAKIVELYSGFSGHQVRYAYVTFRATGGEVVVKYRAWMRDTDDTVYCSTHKRQENYLARDPNDVHTDDKDGLDDPDNDFLQFNYYSHVISAREYVRVWFKCRNKATGSGSDASNIGVYVDSVHRGVTDSNGYFTVDLKTGPHDVEFEGEGYPRKGCSIVVPDTDIYVVDVSLTGQLKTDLITPYEGETHESVQVLHAKVTFRGNPISGAEVKFFLDGSHIGSVPSDGNGDARLSRQVSDVGPHSWYTKSEKTNWFPGTSPTWTFTIREEPPPPDPPGPPRNLVATGRDQQVDLSWFAPTTDGGSPITNYKIYRGTSPGGETPLVTLGNVLSYTDTSVTNGVTYYYKVSAVNTVGEGGKSNEASATPTADTGTLSVDTAPVKGEVFVNGQPWGTAPQSRTVNVDSYTVSFGSVSGYVTPPSQTVHVYEGQTTNVQVVYAEPVPPLSVSVSASPNSITTGQSSAITVTVTSGGSAVSDASVDLSSDGGSLNPTSGTTDGNGRFTSTFSSGSTGTFTITASASKSGYNSGSGSTQVSQQPSLSVQVSANPSSIDTGQSSTITVTVTSGGSAVSGASVSLSKDGGSLNPTSGTTDGNGRFTSTFSSGSTGTFIITASASKSGYNSGFGSAQVTVTKPSLEVSIVKPENATNFEEFPILFEFLVASHGQNIHGASAKLFVDDKLLQEKTSLNGHVYFTVEDISIGSHEWYVKVEKTGYDASTSEKRILGYKLKAISDFAVNVVDAISALQIDQLLKEAGKKKPTEFVKGELPSKIGGWTIHIVFSVAELKSIIDQDISMEKKRELIDDWLVGKVTAILAAAACKVLIIGAVTTVTGGTLTIPAYLGSSILCGYAAAFVEQIVKANWREIADAIVDKIKQKIYSWFEITEKLHSIIQYLYNRVITTKCGSSTYLLVVDKYGRRTGAVNEGGVWTSATEIPNSVYSGVNSYPQRIAIALPAGEEYTITIVGNETGSYRLEVTDYADASIVSQEVFSSLLEEAEIKTVKFVSSSEGIRVLPVLYNFNLPSSAVKGETLQIQVNVSRQNLSSVRIDFLDTKNGWHNYTAVWIDGVYASNVDTSEFMRGYYGVFLSAADEMGYVQTWTCPFTLLGRLMITGQVSKAEATQGERITVSFGLHDQDGRPVDLADVFVSLAGENYSATNTGGGQYEALIDTSGLDGGYSVGVTGSKEGYKEAEYGLSIFIRPWWWPYLQYGAVILLASIVATLLRRARGPKPPVVKSPEEIEKIIKVSPEVVEALKEAKIALEDARYASAVIFAVDRLRAVLLERLRLRSSATNEEIIEILSRSEVHVDLREVRSLLRLSDRCRFDEHKPTEREAREALEKSSDILRNLGEKGA